MATDTHIYGEIDNKTNLQEVALQIRNDVRNAKSRSELTELYRRAGYLVTLSYASSWKEKFGKEIKEIRDVADDEFAKTARAVNRQANEVGTDADYDEKWGD
ncbi:hypothetical protein [uncultured Rubinisphaera sp.]|uniref:hypothetical protein n=1 Tax=uncultured Rubinisphaera sp. TaxID=1678686 RepID=UPI0030DBD8E3